jgi:hypothetical protein
MISGSIPWRSHELTAQALDWTWEYKWHRLEEGNNVLNVSWLLPQVK